MKSKDNSKLIIKTMEEVMHESMIPYSEYVIMDRALPRVEDGLKPVQRRVLYSMYELGIAFDKPYKKSARIVGDCLGKYHPHGDSSIYGAMVRLAQPFNMGAVLVDGHGNFGSIDGDGAAAMRYTEARLSPLAQELLKDLEKDTVKWADNFDNTCKEPEYLPGKFPNLLVNGASGIAVGLATNIPPHNLVEAIDGVIAYINNPKITLKEMMKIIKGPDFPSGGILIAEELEKAYETGKGRVTIRAKVRIESENDRRHIIIDEVPYQVNKANLLKNILSVRERKKGGVLDGISEILDESDRSGIRGVIKLKKDAKVDKILDELFKATNLQTTFGINMVAIADGKPQQMGLLDIIAYYADYQRTVLVRRTKFELDQAKERMHILEGLVTAVRNIDEVVKIIKGSKNTTQAKENLRHRFELSERQAQAIIDLRLGRLTSLEILKLENELEEIKHQIQRLSAILGSKKLQYECIIEELSAIKRQYKYPRKTEIIYDVGEYKVATDEPKKMTEDCIVVVNAAGDIKKMTQKSFNMAQKDFTETSTINEMCHIVKLLRVGESLLCFTNLGNCYRLQPEEIPDARWREKRTSIKKVIKDILPNERIIYILAVGEEMPRGDLLFFTRQGMVKRTAISEYDVKKAAYQAARLKDDDQIIAIEPYKKEHSLMFITSGGICLNADMSDIPQQGRISGGVRGIKLAKNDKCIAIGQVDNSYSIALISDNGLAKKVNAADIDVIGRYNKGVKIADLKAGSKLIFALLTNKDTKLVVETGEGFMQGFSTAAFSVENRTHAGRPLYRGKDKITNVYIYSDDFTN